MGSKLLKEATGVTSGDSQVDVTGFNRQIVVFPCRTVAEKLNPNMYQYLR